MGQISTLRRGDLFMPGDDSYIVEAINKGLAKADTKQVIAFFVPVILVPKENQAGITSLADFTRKGLRIGLGDPRIAAVGRQAHLIFEKSKIAYESVKPQVLYLSRTVEELGVAVSMNSVDAAIVWDVTARNFAEKTKMIEIPPAQNIISPIAVVVLGSSSDPALSARFGELATTEQARAQLQKMGWKVQQDGK